MENTVKKSPIRGIDKLTWLTPEQLFKLEESARMYGRYSNIGIRVISVSSEQIIVRVYQGLAFSENYASKKRLTEIGKELFEPIKEGRNLYVGASPFEYPVFISIQTNVDLEQNVDKYFSKRRDFVDYVNQFGFVITENVLSNHINGNRELTEWHKMAYSFALSFYKFNKGNEKVDFYSSFEKMQEEVQSTLEEFKKASAITESTQKALSVFSKANESIKKFSESLKIQPVNIPKFTTGIPKLPKADIEKLWSKSSRPLVGMYDIEKLQNALKSSLQILQQTAKFREVNKITGGDEFIKSTIEEVKEALEKVE